MLSKKIETVLNEQINKEIYSSNLYLAMASWAETSGYPGVANWLYAQADEERQHMLKFFRYINDRGGKAIISAIAEPPQSFENVHSVFKAILEHEEFISQSINEIVAACFEEKDYTTQNWVQWFVTEQIEEEAQVKEILDKLNLVGDNNMYLFDRDIMSMRGTTPAV